MNDNFYRIFHFITHITKKKISRFCKKNKTYIYSRILICDYENVPLFLQLFRIYLFVLFWKRFVFAFCVGFRICLSIFFLFSFPYSGVWEKPYELIVTYDSTRAYERGRPYKWSNDDIVIYFLCVEMMYINVNEFKRMRWRWWSCWVMFCLVLF